MNFILVILGILMAFFIPGYILITLFFRNLKFKIPISIGLSVCIITFIGFVLGLFGLLKSGYLWFFLLMLILIPFVYYRKLFLNELKKINFKKVFNKKNLLILFLLIFVFLAVYFVRFGPSEIYLNSSPHSAQEFFIPIHSDEWTHLSQIKYSMGSGENVFVNPYFVSLPKNNNFEVGFHTFTASFFLLTGLDPVEHYYLLAAIFASIAALLIYCFLFLLTKQRIAGIFGMLFFLSLPSNSSLLGSWFYVPSSMSIFLIFLFLIILYQAKKTKDYYLLAFILVLSLLIYPFVAILLGIISIFYWIKERDRLKLRFNLKHRGILGVIIGLVLIFIILLTDFKAILSLLFFEKGWRYLEGIYSPFALMGWGWLFFSFVGIFAIFVKEYKKEIVYLLGILSTNILIFYLFDKSFLFMYRINFYYFLLFMGIFGAIGVSYLVGILGKKVKKENLKFFAQILLILGILLILFSGYYSIENSNHRIYRIMDFGEYQTLEKIGQNYSGEVILSNILISQYVYPITDNFIVAILSSNLGGGDTKRVHEFFSEETSCERKIAIYHETGSNIIISKEPITNCPEIEKYLNPEFVPIYYIY